MAVFPGPPPDPLGLKVELNLAGSWVDVSSFVYQRDMVQITGMGRTDETGTIQPSQLTLTLQNDGRFTPKNPAGAYYPNIIRNTPIRVSVNATSAAPSSVAYTGYRYSGEVSSWPPTSDISQHDTYVQITASGIWRRISQSQATIGSAYARYMARLTGTFVPVSWWTMEDGTGATSFAVAIGAGSAGRFTGTPSFAANGTAFPGSDAIAEFNNSKMTFPVSSVFPPPADNVTRYALAVPAGGDSNAGGIQWNISETDSTGTLAKLEVFLNPAGTLSLEAHNSAGSLLFTVTTKTNIQGQPVLVSAELTPSGGTINYALSIIAPNGAAPLETKTGTITGSIGGVTQVILNRSGVLSDTAVGQLGVFGAVPPITTAASAIGGYIGEFAVPRFQRLCGEFSIIPEVTGSVSAAMGPQTDDTLANVFQVIENTDGGALYEPSDLFGLGYRTLGSLKDQSPAVTLNYASGVLGAPLAATYDDQLLKNQWTVANWDGYTVAATLVSGALSVQPVPAGAGLYAGGPLNISAQTDAQTSAIATQRLFQGTVDDVRYPQLTVNYVRAQAAPVFAAVPGLRVGDYLQVTNLPAFAGGGTAKQLAWGWTETLNAFTWTQVLNTIPELPFESSYSPGVYQVGQVPGGSVAGAAGGGGIAGSQIGSGAVGGGQIGPDISARTVGGTTAFTGPAIPYDWTFNVSGTPADGTYFICTNLQAFPIAVGDTFSVTGGLGGPFTVTTLDPPSGGNTNVRFTPTATSVMTTGTVTGGKNGDLWVNSSGGNQVNIWAAGAWTPVTFNAAATIAAGTVTASLVAAGTVIAGIIDGTIVHGSQFISTGTQTSGDYLSYEGPVALDTLVQSYNQAAGTDSAGNAVLSGYTVYTGQAGAWLALNISPDVTGFSWYTNTGTHETAWTLQGELFPQIAGPVQIRNSGYGFQVGTSAANEFIQMTAYALYNLLVSPPAIPAAGVQLYAGGRALWMQNAQGLNMPLERSQIGTGTRAAVNNTTLTQLSDAIFYQAHEAEGLVSEYEIECRGSGATGGSGETLAFGIFISGGAQCVCTCGSSMIIAGDSFSFSVRAVITVTSTGTSGSVNLHLDGQVGDTTNNRLFYSAGANASGGAPISRDLTGVSFNTALTQNIYITAQWGGQGGPAQNCTASTTRITRRGG